MRVLARLAMPVTTVADSFPISMFSFFGRGVRGHGGLASLPELLLTGLLVPGNREFFPIWWCFGVSLHNDPLFPFFPLVD